MPAPVFKRILLKISGEALAAQQGFGVDTARIHEVAAELADVHSLGIQLAIVVGGGNFFRGVADQAKDMDRVSADHMGMLATVINALALQDALEKQNVFTRVQSAIEMNQVAEPFIRRRARSWPRLVFRSALAFGGKRIANLPGECQSLGILVYARGKKFGDGDH